MEEGEDPTLTQKSTPSFSVHACFSLSGRSCEMAVDNEMNHLYMRRCKGKAPKGPLTLAGFRRQPRKVPGSTTQDHWKLTALAAKLAHVHIRQVPPQTINLLEIFHLLYYNLKLASSRHWRLLLVIVLMRLDLPACCSCSYSN